MDQIKIGNFISERRKMKKLTQSDLAYKLNITDRAISKWENGICLPDSGTMPELCEILDITINDLFSGKIVDMKEREKQLEENLLEMTKVKEEKDKKLLHLEIVMGIVCLIPLINSILIVGLNNLEEWIGVIIILVSLLPLLIATPFALKIEQVAGYYECKYCHHKHIPTYANIFLALHINRTRYLRCPECNKKSWQKKVISKKSQKKGLLRFFNFNNIFVNSYF